MKTDNVVQLPSPEAAPAARSVLDELVREGGRRMLQAAIEGEVEEFVAQFANTVDIEGRRVIVRNGYLPERDLVTGVGPMTIKQPRVRDRTGQQKFTSKILPPFLRRLPTVGALIPILYLKGVSTNDFSEALSAILGPNASGLSASNIVRLKEGWAKEHEEWSKRDLSGKRYVYLWADGIYFNVRLDKDRPCILVLMGATAGGKKELVAIWDGHRESKSSWQGVLRDIKRRGLAAAPKLAIGDGALGFWSALEEEFPETEHQRCWVHKTANILDKLPKPVQPDAKALIHEMYMAPTLKTAKSAYAEFVERFASKYPKASSASPKTRTFSFRFTRSPPSTGCTFGRRIRSSRRSRRFGTGLDKRKAAGRERPRCPWYSSSDSKRRNDGAASTAAS